MRGCRSCIGTERRAGQCQCREEGKIGGQAEPRARGRVASIAALAHTHFVGVRREKRFGQRTWDEAVPGRGCRAAIGAGGRTKPFVRWRGRTGEDFVRACHANAGPVRFAAPPAPATTWLIGRPVAAAELHLLAVHVQDLRAPASSRQPTQLASWSPTTGRALGEVGAQVRNGILAAASRRAERPASPGGQELGKIKPQR